MTYKHAVKYGGKIYKAGEEVPVKGTTKAKAAAKKTTVEKEAKES